MNEMNAEERLRNAFRGAPLTSEDVAEMQRRVLVESKKWKNRKNKIENAGELLDEVQIERGRKSAERHRRKLKWMKRELSEADKLRLQSAWGN
ncbi:hypothetical protein [Pontitalea aquivivens]|uniref:hypothetical protein n=1 Tax=Pontitalea aquivivens TaxID=3388663 RepID=UPI003970C09A